ncbi:MAG: UdgX family uracil-DNA binding protein [Acidimicrobiales bacterium]
MPPPSKRGPATVARPSATDLDGLRLELSSCRACPLWQRATQPVFGEGKAGVPLMIVGEQPGDREDIEGEPFVGPAGHLLDRALGDASIERSTTYVTNAVKHFKWEERGKRRLHKRPTPSELLACLPWLEAELAAVAPRLLLLLGATATDAVLGSGVRVLRDRGKVMESRLGVPALVTVHPSSILRSRDEEERAKQYDAFVDDLKTARSAL